jgi:biotin/methionine sulfoxide reductase
MMTGIKPLPHYAHWGAFSAWQDGDAILVRPHPNDPDPSPILGNVPAAARHPARLKEPLVREGWLSRGTGPDARRGREHFVPMSWPRVLNLLADELRRVYERYGAESVYGGSYGWSSAGRFHHAQSQLHRFLNVLGGYVRSVNSYSAGASAVIIPHVFGPFEQVARRAVTWSEVVAHTELLVAFGGMALKNSMVGSGGVSQHIVRGALRQVRARGAEFVLVSPLRDDLPEEVSADWLPVTPGTDTALMLGLAHTLLREGLHDRDFLARCCVGFERFADYLAGSADGLAKDAEWASGICGIPATDIVALARRMAGRRTAITVSHSLQRAEHGEQPVWMGLVLACMLGQVGLPGGGFGYSLGALANVGKPALAVPIPTLPQGRNAVKAFIPVARIADMLLNPGAEFDYDGRRMRYPDIRLVYWAGGNPFHHHQDLNRLRAAFARPETIVVHDSAATATARHADIVLPSTVSLERNDLGAAANDALMVAMHRICAPYAEARNDYDIFGDLAERLGVREQFTEGRGEMAWLRRLYEETRAAMHDRGNEAPDFDTFWQRGELVLPPEPDEGGPLADLRADPAAAPLLTPSGKIEIFSEEIATFGYADCPGHPAWLPPTEAPAKDAPLWLVANQPATRLHSQLDFGEHSQSAKLRGREPVRMHPTDAAARGITTGDVVRLFNERGACLSVAIVTEDVRPGVAQLSTGAWYDPDDAEAEAPLCVHGNPNVLTRDVGTSRLAQGCTGQLTCIEIERFAGNLPPIRAYDPPELAEAAPYVNAL